MHGAHHDSGSIHARFCGGRAVRISVVDGSTATGELAEGMIWNKGTSTLILNGYNGGGIDFGSNATYGDGKVTIDLQGDSTITVADTVYSIRFTQITEANFTGSGSLTINMSNEGSSDYRAVIGYGNVAAATDLNFNGGTVSINVTNTQEKSAYGIEVYQDYVPSGINLTVAEDATLNINLTSNQDSKYTMGLALYDTSVAINGARLIVSGSAIRYIGYYGEGIESIGTAKLTGGASVYARNSYATRSLGSSSLLISDATLECEGAGVDDQKFRAAAFRQKSNPILQVYVPACKTEDREEQSLKFGKETKLK